MATAITSRSGSLHPADWTNAAFARLSSHGIEAVRVEVLARDLRVSKGSFYWHFRDRGDLLERMLDLWEIDELRWLEKENGAGAAARWARFVARSADPERIRREVALRSWARQDERVAMRVAELDRKKTRLIAAVLLDIGFTGSAAQKWSEVALLVCLGWIERASRDPTFQGTGLGLGEFLSNVILAASAGTAPIHT
jgi:AcrR family transcriptional regulator